MNELDDILKEVETSTDEIVNELNGKASSLRQARDKFEKRWWIVDRFVAGNHFDVYNQKLNEITSQTFPDTLQVRPVHLAIRSIEGIINNLLASDPLWKVYPLNLNLIQDENAKQERIDNTKILSAYFSNLWDVEGMREKATETIWNALLYNFGILEIYWENAPKVKSISPYDILFDPTVKSIQDSKIIIKESAVPLEEIQNNPLYSDAKKELKPDTKVSGSNYQEMRLNEMFNQLKNTQDKALLRECWKKSPQGGWNVWHICQNKLLFSAYYPRFKNPPFVSYRLNPTTLLFTSWLERLIPLNRSIDLTLAQIEAWIRATAIGRMKRKTGTQVERITNASGEFIDINGPLDSIEWLNVPEIGVTPFQFLTLTEELMTTIGATTVSVGKIPKGARAGYKMVESLKASEMSSIQHAVRLFEDFLEHTAETILSFISIFGDHPLGVNFPDNTFAELAGTEYASQFHNVIPVSDIDFGIDVKIESGLAYTPEGRKETATQLYQLGMIPADTALELMGLGGDLEDIAQRGLQEALAKKVAMKNAPEGMTPATQSLQPPINPNQPII